MNKRPQAVYMECLVVRVGKPRASAFLITSSSGLTPWTKTTPARSATSAVLMT